MGEDDREEDGVESEGMTEVPPVAELDNFELSADDEFTAKVRQSIGRREVASGIVDLSTRGFFQVLLDYLSTIFGDLFSPPDSGEGDKES